jgi:hypothetical protein
MKIYSALILLYMLVSGPGVIALPTQDKAADSTAYEVALTTWKAEKNATKSGLEAREPSSFTVFMCQNA